MSEQVVKVVVFDILAASARDAVVCDTALDVGVRNCSPTSGIRMVSGSESVVETDEAATKLCTSTMPASLSAPDAM
eukprot:858248-Amphidinium_carterae.1